MLPCFMSSSDQIVLAQPILSDGADVLSGEQGLVILQGHHVVLLDLRVAAEEVGDVDLPAGDGGQGRLLNVR